MARELAESETGLRVAVHVGSLNGESPRRLAERWLADVAPSPDAEAVLLVVAPEERRVELVTTAATRTRLPDETCSLIVASMTSSFAVGDLVGGIVHGLRMIGERARRERSRTRPGGRPSGSGGSPA
jgi:uncharacterized membrane protein YgcG